MELKIPETLYKYRTIPENSNDFSIRKIWIASPRDFNDPFDCGISFQIEKTSNPAKKEAFVTVLKQKKPHLNREERRSEARDMEKGFRRTMKDRDRVEELRDQMIDFLRETIGVYSLSSEFQSILMWSHYAKNHEGYCIEFDSEKLISFLRRHYGPPDVFFRVLKVEYKEEYPKLRVEGDGPWRKVLDDMLSIKSDKWCYEGEYRLIFDGRNEFSVTVPQEIISKVYLGARMTEKSKKFLREHAAELDVNVVELTTHRSKFELVSRDLGGC